MGFRETCVSLALTRARDLVNKKWTMLGLGAAAVATAGYLAYRAFSGSSSTAETVTASAEKAPAADTETTATTHFTQLPRCSVLLTVIDNNHIQLSATVIARTDSPPHRDYRIIPGQQVLSDSRPTC